MDQKLQAFLDLIAWSEGTSTSPVTKNNGYDVIVSGVSGPSVFTDYSDHPFAGNRAPVVVRRVPLLVSTAAGRYQLLARYWNVYKVQLSLPDFGPDSQDAVAIQQMREKHAVDKVLAGDVEGAVKACSTVWASFPGNDYEQGGKSMEALLDQHQNFIST